MISVLVAATSGFLAGFLITKRHKKEDVVKGSTDPTYNWVELPSGWSKSINGTTEAFAMVFDRQTAYWWINRNGRTIVEGPTLNLDSAKEEILKAEKDFLARM